jgi:hypothetical protein
MATGVGIYPNGWDSSEIQQACGNTSKSYSLGKWLIITFRFYFYTINQKITRSITYNLSDKNTRYRVLEKLMNVNFHKQVIHSKT